MRNFAASRKPPLRKRMQGVAAVEFGILLVPMILLLFGITEFGRAIYSYNTLDKSVRDAARYLTSKTPGAANEHATAKCMVVHGSPTCSGPILAPGLTTAMVQTCDAILTCAGINNTLTTGTGTINTVTVKITGYQFNSVVDFVVPDITFGGISTTMRSQL